MHKSRVKGGLMFHLLTPTTILNLLPLHLPQEIERPKAGVLSCLYNSVLMLRNQSLNYERAEDPLDAPEIKTEGTLLTRIAVIVLKGSIAHSKV